MGFVLANLLHYAQIVYRCEESSPGEVGDWLFGKRIGGKPKLVNLGRLSCYRRLWLNA